ncbi:hypothetical protein [Halomonas sp. CKK8]|uniref:hypothetical protein n=1 Tax=Halomonas sp. CKK8 TaxID=3036127 RepID=UPI0024155474|nr:hypothetical protein [Halomonas sp. CKK8]WFM72909.1 hypothetical protein P8934_07925 [Halomonas sp. CKK8]
MTTWLPAVLIGWVVFCTVTGLTAPMFNSNSPHIRASDRVLGTMVGLFIGIVTGAIGYALVRLATWAIGGGS